MKFNNLNCRSTPEFIVNTIDEVSSLLLEDISEFNIHLFNNGKHYKPGGSGCSHNDTQKCSRDHGFPKFAPSALYRKNGIHLKRVYDMTTQYEIECEAPLTY